MADLIEYKCPACGGALEFNSALQKMKCPFCDSEYSMEELKAKDEELNSVSAKDTAQNDMSWEMSEGNEWRRNIGAAFVCVPFLRRRNCGRFNHRRHKVPLL